MTFWQRWTRSERVTAVMLGGAAVLLALALGLPTEADPEATGEWDALALGALLALIVYLAVLLPSVLACLTREERVHDGKWRDRLDRALPVTVWLFVAAGVLL